MINSRESQLPLICVVNNIHGLFMYYLVRPEDFKKTTFIVSDGISQDVKRKLPSSVLFPSFNNYPKLISLLLRAIYYRYKNFCLHLKMKKSKVYGHDHLYFSQLYIKRSAGFVLIEDGLANYASSKQNRKSLFRKYLFGSSGPFFGWGDDINEIILSGIVNIPEEISRKVTQIDISKSWNNLSSIQKNYFLDLFSDEPYVPLSKVVIFTQPFSEDGMMSETEKIAIYKVLYEHYCSIYDKNEICIKSHPRENTDYSRYFDCTFIQSKIPGQIMILMDQPEVLATIYSSVGFVKGNAQTHVWGTSFNESLLKKAGYFEGNYNGFE
ncbi:hypothetical protein M2429_002207 [Enterobacter sp. A4]